jgi:hypothetical protein
VDERCVSDGAGSAEAIITAASKIVTN